MNDKDTHELQKAARSLLDDSAVQLDEAIESRLTAIRAAAMARHPKRQPERHARLLDASRHLLDDSVTRLDPGIVRDLDQARHAALGSQRRSTDGFLQQLLRWLDGHRLAVPAGAFATACIMVTAVSLFYAGNEGNPPVSLEDEIRLFASAEDVELYENLDFYLWLAENGLAAN
ncbi:MAG: hypothetical protein RLZZ385_135 [Pseudomonadota bacterium]|jgi:hypothetical protein